MHKSLDMVVCAYNLRAREIETLGSPMFTGQIAYHSPWAVSSNRDFVSNHKVESDKRKPNLNSGSHMHMHLHTHTHLWACAFMHTTYTHIFLCKRVTTAVVSACNMWFLKSGSQQYLNCHYDHSATSCFRNVLFLQSCALKYLIVILLAKPVKIPKQNVFTE